MTGVQTCALPDRKSTRLNSSHTIISYAVFCLKKNKHGSSAAGEVGKTLGVCTQDVAALAHTRVTVAAQIARLPKVFNCFHFVALFFLKDRPTPKFSLFPHPNPFRF